MLTNTRTRVLQVTCVSKSDRPNPHDRITHVGGDGHGGWRLTQQEAIDMIDRGDCEFRVLVKGRSVRVVTAVGPQGDRYLRTSADGQFENNLLTLPDCLF
jgi:Protein of unknown function (DUF3892)